MQGRVSFELNVLTLANPVIYFIVRISSPICIDIDKNICGEFDRARRIDDNSHTFKDIDRPETTPQP